MFKTIIDEMFKGNFSFLILIIGILQLIVMCRKGKKDRKTMTSQVYKNLKELNYGELLSAIDRVREKLYEEGTDIKDADMQYYIALMQELDNRQKEE